MMNPMNGPPDRPSAFDTLMARARPAREGAPAPETPALASSAGPRYERVDAHSRGGMGCIWKVRDRDLDRLVVMKTVEPSLLAEPGFAAALVREARIAGSLQHPNIMPVLDVGLTQTGEFYFTMPLFDGRTLLDVIERLALGDEEAHARWGFAERLQVVLKVCDAVAFAHARGILHRDLKPSNVMVGDCGQVLVLDWGLARPLASLRADEGYVVGTPGYMAPEQVLGDSAAVSTRSDVFGLGALVYHLFALRPPFPDVREGVRAAPPPADRDVMPRQGRVPREIAVILERALQLDPARRHADAAEMRDALQAYARGAAPVVCVHTGLKRAIAFVAWAVDRHGAIAIGALAIAATLPWALLIVALSL